MAPTVPEQMRSAWLRVAKKTAPAASDSRKGVICPACDTDNEWEPLGQLCGIVVLNAKGNHELGSDLIPSANLGAVAYVCNHCGFVRFHHFPDILSSVEK